MARSSYRTDEWANAVDGGESLKWTIVDLASRGPSGQPVALGQNENTSTICVVVFVGTANIALTAAALHLRTNNYLRNCEDTAGKELFVELARARGSSDQAGWSLARVEEEHVQRVLADCGGNKSEAARRLGVTRKTLQARLKKSLK
jgi:two-component system response regulator RegA